MIVALAGRRIDPPHTDPPRFPLGNVGLVRERLHALFSTKGATALVCSAACGADLLALEVAGKLNMRRRIVLPFSVEEFRATSVVDRPGDWGPSYDLACTDAANREDLVLLGCSTHDTMAYSKASNEILHEAERLQSQTEEAPPIHVVVVWEGSPRGADDETEAFRRNAEWRGLLSFETILTV